MKGLKAKKNGKTNKYKKFQVPETTGKSEAKSNSEASTYSTEKKAFLEHYKIIMKIN